MGVQEDKPLLSDASSPPADSEAIGKPFSFVGSYLSREGLVSHIRGCLNPLLQSSVTACRRGYEDGLQWVRAGGRWRLIVAVTVSASGGK